MKHLTWQQIYRWRLKRQGLDERFASGQTIPVVRQIIAAQAQVLSAAGLGLAVRVDGLTLQQMDDALWRDHSLFKIWAMRDTLHLIAAEDLPLLSAARSQGMDGYWIKYFEYYGLTSSHYHAFLEAVAAILTNEPLTRQQLAAAVANHMRQPELEQVFLTSSWGSFWKPCTYAGTLVFGPGQGQHPTFINPRHVMAEWPVIAPEEAHREILHRFLKVYGPASPVDYGHWWNGGSWITKSRTVFREMEAELEPVDVDGVTLHTLLGSADEIAECVQPAGIRLLPLFDEYTFTAPRTMPGVYAPRVFRPQGWISAVVLDDGLIRATWDYVVRPEWVDLTVEFFEPATPSQKNGVMLEVERLRTYWGKPVNVIFAGG